MNKGDIVVCIDNSGEINLTIDKMYYLVSEHNKFCFVYDDKGKQVNFFKNRFLKLEEWIEQELNKIEDEDN